MTNFNLQIISLINQSITIEGGEERHVKNEFLAALAPNASELPPIVTTTAQGFIKLGR